MIRARCLAIVAACVVAALSVASATAAPPSVEVTPFELIEIVAPGEPLLFGTNPCPFTITVHHQGTFVATTFFDQNGTPIRQLVRSQDFTETYSANGRSLTTISPAVVTVTIDPTTGGFIFSGSGNQRHLTVPGVGLVLAQAGHQVSDGEGNLISFTGLNIPAGSDFCSALSA
ncbi:MAG: hypothetical protein ACJ734_10955 [Gaiellaceae bacterium]